MSPDVVHYVPIVTTILAIPFALEIFRRYREHPERLHLLWWAIGIATYGVGTFTEATTTLVGWNEPTFRAWYISGALLGGAPLAQGDRSPGRSRPRVGGTRSTSSSPGLPVSRNAGTPPPNRTG